MRKTLKKYIPLILFLIILAALISGVLYYYFTGQPDAASVEQMKTALTSQNLKPVDVTDSALEKFQGAGLNDCIAVEQDDIRFEFYNFDNVHSSMEVYRQAHTLIITTRLAYPRVEISYGKVNYQVYTLEADGIYSVSICVGNTAVYATCNAENATKINGILDSVGYIDTNPNQDSHFGLARVLSLLQFIVYIPMALVGRHYLWCAAYKSAGVTRKQLDRSEKTKKELPNWFIEISPRKKTTKTILTVYRLSLIPEYIGVILAFATCFTPQLKGLINIFGVAIPGIIVVTGVAGILLGKIFTRKNNRKIGRDF